MLKCVHVTCDNSLPKLLSRLVISLQNPNHFQSVRWRTKPRWVPIAKSKMFRIPERRRYRPDENAEVIRLFNNYRHSLKSIRQYFREKTKATMTAPEVLADLQTLDEEDHKRCMELNREWNAEVAKVRETRLEQQKEARLAEIRQCIEETNLKIEQEKREVERIVREEKERSKLYITAEKVDQAIETALSAVTDHNYAIDLEGNIYRGRRTKPANPKEVVKIQAQTSN